MADLSWLYVVDGQQYFLLNRFIVGDLILEYVDHDHAQVKLGDVLLKFQTAVDRQQNIKLILSSRKQRAIIERIPFLLVDRSALVIGK